VPPIKEKRCFQCHKKDKKKGRLSIQSYESILKGGKHGPAVVPGDLNESELYKRITLDPSHEDFMPQDGKTPLTGPETEMIRWWIEKAMAVKDKKIAEVKNHGEIASLAAFLLKVDGQSMEETTFLTGQAINGNIPDTVNMTLVSDLRTKGLVVRTMLQDPLMLDVTLPARSGKKIAEITEALKPLAGNIIMLNLSDNNLTENDLGILELMSNLQKLRLEKNPISDSISNHLVGLQYLEAVNLNETKIGPACLDKLRNNPSIKRIYTWRTKCDNLN
jgi:hypothetical protein